MSRFGDLAFGPVTKGDLNVGSGTGVGTLAIGTNGQVLTVDTTQPLDVKWATPTPGVPGGSTTNIQFNSAGSFGGIGQFRFDGTNIVIGGVGNNNAFRVQAFATVQLGESGVGSGVYVLTVPAGSPMVIGFFGATPVIQQTANAALTDATTGTPATTLVDVDNTGLADPALCNDNFASIATQLAAIRLLLVNYGLGA